VSGDCLPLEAAPLARSTDRIYVASIRFDKYLTAGPILTFEGGVAHVAGPVLQSGIGRVQLLDVSRPWTRFNLQTSHISVLAYYSGRQAPKQLSLGSGANLALTSHRGRVEAQGHWSAAANKVRVVAGAAAGLEKIDSLDSATGRQTLLFEPVRSNTQAIFGQVDWNVRPALKLVVAARADTSSLHDLQFTPKASIVYTFRDQDSIRVTYNQGFQVPNHAEFFAQADAAPAVDLSGLNQICAAFGVNSCGFGITRILALGNKDLKLEKITTWEVGYKGLLRGRAFVTLDYYRSVANDFVTDLLPQLGTALGRINPNFGPWQGPEGLPAQAVAAISAAAPPILSNNLDGTPILAAVSYTNFGTVNTQGIDLGVTGYLPRGWSATFNYSWFDYSISSNAFGLDRLLLPNSPEHKFVVGGAYTGRRLYASVNLRRVTTFRWAVGPFQGDVRSYATVDVAANRAIDNRWSVGVNASNLLNDEHWESFGGDVLRRRVLASIHYKW
jgi:outer membrane receptor protein involved in Fe transport